MDIYTYKSLRLEHCGIAAAELHLRFLKELPVLARQQKNRKQENIRKRAGLDRLDQYMSKRWPGCDK